MIKPAFFIILFLFLLKANTLVLFAQWKVNDMLRPKPPEISIGKRGVPSDAIILFDGQDVAHWRNRKDGSQASWKVIDSCLVASLEWNDIRTVQNFGDCQLHIDFIISSPVKGEYNMHGNSGVVLMGKYEVQIMNSYKFETFSDGQNAAIYGQYPPLANVSLPPDQWQSFDIVFNRPRFGTNGEVMAPAKITMFHNGILVHNNAELKGQSSWLGEIKYEKHTDKLPLVLQSHLHPVRFRNIWIRNLEPDLIEPQSKRKITEISLSKELMDSYSGEYCWKDLSQPVTITNRYDFLEIKLPGNANRELFAYDIDRFFAREIDLWFKFIRNNSGSVTGFDMNSGGTITSFNKR